MMSNKSQTPSLNFTFRQGLPNTLDGRRTVIALGTFDGVHIAHQRLIKEALRLKERINADLVGVWCFEESPAAIIQKSPTSQLTTKAERIALLFENGVDFVVMGKFEELRDLEAKNFIDDILISGLGCVATVCGYNHRFGQSGLGDSRLLSETFGQKNTITLPEIKLHEKTVSSSAIREHLICGEIETANNMLGRPISFCAPVSEGKKLGRKIGFPTANQIFPKDFFPLKKGVYATKCLFDDGNCYIGVSNVGVRPSIEKNDNHHLNCETYIIGFSGEIYGRDMRVEFHSYLREEMKFSTLDELSLAIKADCEKTIKIFATEK